MKNILLCFIFLPFICFAENESSFPEGRWEGFQDLGIGGNAAFIMNVDSKGNGFYGYSLRGQRDGAVCMPISKTTMQQVGWAAMPNISIPIER